MRSAPTLLILAAAALTAPPSEARAEFRPTYPPPVGWYEYAAPPGLDRIGEVLEAIDSPQRRSDLAEEWIEFSHRAIARNLELREEWLSLQQRQIRHEQQIEQLRMEMYQMQQRIEQLRTENLLLERENLQLQLQLQKARRPSAEQPRAEPSTTGEPSPIQPPDQSGESAGIAP